MTCAKLKYCGKIFLRQMAVACIVLLSLSLNSSAAEQSCDGSESKITPSPAGNWMASVQERVCTTESGVAANVQVTVASKKSPDEATLVAAIAVPRSRDEWPKVVWRSETSLEVWVPNFAHVLEVKPVLRDVVVALKYCADDPVARASVAQYQVDVKRWMEAVTSWAKLHKADPDAAGERPPRPEEPRVTNQPCQPSDIP
jgi:hypothetical protein